MTITELLQPPRAVVFAAPASVRTASATPTRYIRRGNLNPFGIYCLLFGATMIIYNA